MTAPPPSVHSAIVTVGDELLLGRTVDTNGAWLGRRLADLGIAVLRQETVADDRSEIRRALSGAVAAAVSPDHHDDRDVLQLGIRLDGVAERLSVHVGHEEVRQDDVGLLPLGDLEGLLAALRGDHAAGAGQEEGAQLAEHRDLVDHQDGSSRIHGIPPTRP